MEVRNKICFSQEQWVGINETLSYIDKHKSTRGKSKVDKPYKDFFYRDITEDDIKSLNKIFRQEGGEYRTEPVWMLNHYTSGFVEQVKASNPENIHAEIAALIKWYYEELDNECYHPLIVTGLFIYEFLSVHPFPDGNGRTSRALIDCLLLDLDYEFIEYCDMGSKMREQRQLMHESLFHSQLKRGTPRENIFRWLMFFLNNIQNSINEIKQTHKWFLLKQKQN